MSTTHNQNNSDDEDEFNYEEFVAEEFGEGKTKKLHIHPIWWLTAVFLLLLSGLMLLRHFWPLF